jgi:hypothetical protein
MNLPRDVQDRLDWFLTHDPADFGMCANHSWRSLGGDYGNPPAWGCSNANQVYDKVKASGRYFTSSPPPRGALVLYRYGSNGHACIAHDEIATTDPSDQGNTPTTGVEDLDYPARWGGTAAAVIWTDTYNGVRFPVGDEDDMPSAAEIADAVWDHKIEDPQTGENVSARELLKRTRTVATQARDEVRALEAE